MKNRSKKMAALLAMSAILTGCSGDKTNQKSSTEVEEVIPVSKTKKVFAPGEHVVRVRERTNVESDFDGQINVPEGYEYNRDLIITEDDDFIYSYTNIVEVEAIGKKNSLTGRVDYDSFGKPTNKAKQQTNEEMQNKALELKKY